MISIRRFSFLLLLFAIFIITSCTQDDEVQPNEAQSTEVKKWIFDEMSFNYLWNTTLPQSYQPNEQDPTTYFNSLLYKDDRFSWIDDDAKSLLDEFEGTAFELGYAPEFGRFANSNRVFIVVEYVYPGSNAAMAGLKRGDIIIKINGSDLTIDNYQDLYNASSQTLTLGQYNGNGIESTNKSLSIDARVTQLNPVIDWEIKNINDIKTGYLVYAKFISGEDDKWLDSLDQVLQNMKNAGIEQLIVDLRYNPGGELRAAEHLASAIAPQNVISNKEVFVTLHYNDILEELIQNSQNGNAPDSEIKFSEHQNNLGLDQVIFLTSAHTASASELIINGLKPYMKVISIGESTVGKFYGSFVITDSHQPPEHNWAIVPLVLKYANANGVSDFVNGLPPDFEVEDNLLEAAPFGDESDPILNKAIAYIKGDTEEMARIGVTKPYISMPDKSKLKKGNILFKQ